MIDFVMHTTNQTTFNPASQKMVRPMSARDVRQRYLLYIVARGGKNLADEIFSAMRRDMSSASVELIYDRRVGERRGQSADVDQDRRASDRRRFDLTGEIANRGWVRVEVKVTPPGRSSVGQDA